MSCFAAPKSNPKSCQRVRSKSIQSLKPREDYWILLRGRAPFIGPACMRMESDCSVNEASLVYGQWVGKVVFVKKGTRDIVEENA